MCLHIWRLYQRHSWSTLYLVTADEALLIKLSMPSCSETAAAHHGKTSASPLYREFSATKGKEDIPIEVDLFGVIKLDLPLEWVV